MSAPQHRSLPDAGYPDPLHHSDSLLRVVKKTMPFHHSAGSAQVLYRVFVQPNLANAARQSIYTTRHSGVASARHFTSTPQRVARHTSAQPEQRTERWDEEITSRSIYLVDPTTNKIEPQPTTRFDVLSRLDRNTHRLIHPNDAFYNNLPVCKIINKKDAYTKQRQQKDDAKERKKVADKEKSVKTLELNWAMDTNDLGHRLSKVEEFLRDGRRVEVVLASKKRGRKASVEECKEVLRRIREVVGGVEGAKEGKGMEGKVGGFATLFFQGRAQVVPPTAQEQQQLARAS